jgi:hypothetical protein
MGRSAQTTAARPAQARRTRGKLSKADAQPVALPYGGPTVLLVAGMSLLVMQVTYSYVDLGLTSMRDMLLLGVMLGVIGHAHLVRSKPPRRSPARRRRVPRGQWDESAETPEGADANGPGAAREPAVP